MKFLVLALSLALVGCSGGSSGSKSPDGKNEAPEVTPVPGTVEASPEVEVLTVTDPMEVTNSAMITTITDNIITLDTTDIKTTDTTLLTVNASAPATLADAPVPQSSMVTGYDVVVEGSAGTSEFTKCETNAVLAVPCVFDSSNLLLTLNTADVADLLGADLSLDVGSEIFTFPYTKWTATKIDTGSLSSDLRKVVAIGDVKFLINHNADGYRKLFKIEDGVLSQLTDLNSTAHDTAAVEPEVLGSHVYFVCLVSSNSELCRTDGVTVERVADLSAGNDNIRELNTFNGHLYFSGIESTWQKIYRTDGVTVTQFSNTNSTRGDNYSFLGKTATHMYFSALISGGPMGMGAAKVFRTDGTNVHQLTDQRSNEADLIGVSFATLGTDVLVFIKNSAGFLKLHKISEDGTITQVSDMRGSSMDDQIKALVTYDEKVYFGATAPGSMDKLYSYDGTNITRVTNVQASLDRADALAVAHGELYIVLANADNYRKLHKFNGERVREVVSLNSTDDWPAFPSVIGDELIFRSNVSGGTSLYSIKEE